MTSPAPATRADQPASSRLLPMALVTWAFIGGVLVLAVALVAVKLTSGSSPGVTSGQSPAPQSVVAAMGGLSPTLFDAAAGAAETGPQVLVDQPSLERAGRSEVVFVGAQSSPYSAAESWALVAALSRFGTFSRLGTVSSPDTEIFGRTPGFSFVGTTYRSGRVALVTTERDTATLSSVAPAGYPSLQVASEQSDALLARYDGRDATLPFLDVANRLTSVGAGIGFSPGLLQNSSMGQVASALHDPSSPVGRAVLAAADEITAAVCSADGGRPAAVCTSAGVQAVAGRLGLP